MIAFWYSWKPRQNILKSRDTAARSVFGSRCTFSLTEGLNSAASHNGPCRSLDFTPRPLSFKRFLSPIMLLIPSPGVSKPRSSLGLGSRSLRFPFVWGFEALVYPSSRVSKTQFSLRLGFRRLSLAFVRGFEDSVAFVRGFEALVFPLCGCSRPCFFLRPGFRCLYFPSSRALKP